MSDCVKRNLSQTLIILIGGQVLKYHFFVNPCLIALLIVV
jgi:hypothetical protein